MKRKLIYTLISSLLALSSCNMIDFSEDCTYYGDVEVVFNWNNLLEGDTKPDLMDTRFYGQTIPARSFKLSGDTLLRDIIAEYHRVLAFNPVNGASYINLENVHLAEAQLPVYEKDSKQYTFQAPLLYTAKQNIEVKESERTLCELIPISCIQQVYIDFIIIKEGITANVLELKGEIGGVMTAYHLYRQQAIESEAVLAFSTKKHPEKEVFSTNLRVFGMNPDKTGKAKIANELDFSLKLDNGMEFSETIDLTDIFSGFTAPSIYLTLEVRIGVLGISSVSITDWYTVNQGAIDL